MVCMAHREPVGKHDAAVPVPRPGEGQQLGRTYPFVRSIVQEIEIGEETLGTHG